MSHSRSFRLKRAPLMNLGCPHVQLQLEHRIYRSYKGYTLNWHSLLWLSRGFLIEFVCSPVPVIALLIWKGLALERAHLFALPFMRRNRRITVGSFDWLDYSDHFHIVFLQHCPYKSSWFFLAAASVTVETPEGVSLDQHMTEMFTRTKREGRIRTWDKSVTDE